MSNEDPEELARAYRRAMEEAEDGIGHDAVHEGEALPVQQPELMVSPPAGVAEEETVLLASTEEGNRRRWALTPIVAIALILPLAILLGYLALRSDGGETAAVDPVSAQQATSSTALIAATTSSSVASTTSPTSSTVSPLVALGLAPLPIADQSVPAVVPAGLFSVGKLILTGSVPSEADAAGYFGKASGVLGPANIVMQMELDPRVTAETLTVDVQEQFVFPTGSADVDPSYASLLNLGVVALELVPESTLVVTGYTDSIGSEAFNLQLSEERAQIVVDWMVERGIPANRIVARGAGETQPIADNGTVEGRQANRRIEATLEGVSPH